MKKIVTLYLFLCLNVLMTIALFGQAKLCEIENELIFDEVNIDYSADGANHIVFGTLAGESTAKIYQFSGSDLVPIPTNIAFPFTDASFYDEQLILLNGEDSIAFGYLINSILTRARIDLDAVTKVKVVEREDGDEWFALSNSFDGQLYEYNDGVFTQIGLSDISYTDGTSYKTHTDREFLVARDLVFDEYISLYDGGVFIDLTDEINFGLLRDFEVVENLNETYDDIIVGKTNTGALSFHRYDGALFENITPVNVGGKWTKYESFTDASGMAYLYVEGKDLNNIDKNGIYAIDNDDYTLTNVTPLNFYNKFIRVSTLSDGNTLISKLNEPLMFVAANGSVNTRTLPLSYELKFEIRWEDTVSYVISEHMTSDALAILEYRNSFFFDVTPTSTNQFEYVDMASEIDYSFIMLSEKLTSTMKLNHMESSGITDITPFVASYIPVVEPLRYIHSIQEGNVSGDNMIHQDFLRIYDPTISRDRIYIVAGLALNEVILNEHTFGGGSETRITEILSERSTNYHRENGYYEKSLIALSNIDDESIALYMINENGHSDLIIEYLSDANAEDAFIFLGLDIDERWYFWVEGIDGSEVQDIIVYDGNETEVLADSFATCCNEAIFNIYSGLGNLGIFRISEDVGTPEIYKVVPEIEVDQELADELGTLDVLNLTTSENYHSNSEVLFRVLEQAELSAGFEVNAGVQLQIEMETCESQLGN